MKIIKLFRQLCGYTIIAIGMLLGDIQIIVPFLMVGAIILNVENIKRIENKIDIINNTDERKEALHFYRHLKDHEEVINSTTFPGIPICKICGKTSKEIFKENQKELKTNE